ncbi:hypothetical protein LRP52_28955 [Photobacterium sp. ZSDE20]|uniref:Uncharacterized protein n=1 Tax=Photobacterium pectinilyticum TaxID=2906793 RepID=A0ABT1N9S5_9GAMM|nr:hypothetical protein [Photobacterium sp. ZSDE20]MCQ1060461.1 hypothetical protein [Photobacterium sp. ZSDE20]MDD1826211.1 hypothetical protein [Photobacterium sp. ZSDE20]
MKNIEFAMAVSNMAKENHGSDLDHQTVIEYIDKNSLVIPPDCGLPLAKVIAELIIAS